MTGELEEKMTARVRSWCSIVVWLDSMREREIDGYETASSILKGNSLWHH
jgi:hypothetical protein